MYAVFFRYTDDCAKVEGNPPLLLLTDRGYGFAPFTQVSIVRSEMVKLITLIREATQEMSDYEFGLATLIVCLVTAFLTNRMERLFRGTQAIEASSKKQN